MDTDKNMELQKHACATICDHLPTLSANHPWFVDHNLENDTRDHIIYTKHNPHSQRRCQIPSFPGRRIRGCYHGWVILSNHPHNNMWSLWNPETSNIIRLPRLIQKHGDLDSRVFEQCCLSSPPDDPGSILIVTAKNYHIVFTRLDCKTKRLKWVEMSYAKQMRHIAGCDSYLYCLTCCNGKLYTLNSVSSNLFVVHIDIVFKGEETMISLLPYLKVPSYFMYDSPSSTVFLKGCCAELFYIELCYVNKGHVEKKPVGGARVSRLDMINKRWELMEDLKGAAFFLDLAHDCSIFYSPAAAVGSELGGYVHFLDKSGKFIHSYDFMNKTIALSSMPPLVRPTTLFQCRLQGNNMRFGTCEENTESRLLSIPFDVLKMVMEFCVGVEYLNFRATCKQCHLAAPMIRWSKGRKLQMQTYSLVSPWLMLFDKDRGVISFTDPMSGDKYFMKTPQALNGGFEIHCSMGGWLLIRRHNGHPMFFNPFTSDIHEIPFAPFFDTYCVTAPPTSSDCMVVGFTTRSEWNVYVHFVGRELCWRRFNLDFHRDSHSFHFATLYRQNLYAVYKNGILGFIDTGSLDCPSRIGLPFDIDAGNLDYKWREGPTSSCVSPKQSFLMKCDQQLLLVIMGEFGECVEVFKLRDSSHSSVWVKIECLGRHAIYISGRACLCVEAKTPEMANKIYFSRFHSENRKIVFYSLETKRYHTLNGQDTEESFVGTKHHLDPHVWIEPSWSPVDKIPKKLSGILLQSIITAQVCRLSLGVR